MKAMTRLLPKSRFIKIAVLILLIGGSMTTGIAYSGDKNNANPSEISEVDFEAMLNEIKSHVIANVGKNPHPFTTEIAEKYISLGMDQEDLLQQCKDNGWEVRKLDSQSISLDTSKYDVRFQCGIEFRLSWRDIWGHGASLSLTFKNNKLAQIESRAFYKHPLS